MDYFKNTTYPIETVDDAINAKGYHLNVLVDEVNKVGGKTDEKNIGNNSSEEFIIGNKQNDRAFFIDYTIVRGTLYEAGTLRIIYKEGPFEYNRISIGDNAGVSFSFSLDADDIIITATTTNSTNQATVKLTTKTIKK